MNWPRAPLLVTMSLYNLRFRLRERTARWQFCFLPRLTNLSNSGRTYEQRNWCRNLSAPLFLVRDSVYAIGLPQMHGLNHAFTLAAERALHFALYIAFGDHLALVAFAATTSKSKFNFDFSVDQLDGKWNK